MKKTAKLRALFPPDDAVATCIARLCIVREDFMLELEGIIANSIAQLDGNAVAWRRTYFFRNSIRTLHEIKSALVAIRKQHQFQQMLSGRYPEFSKKFDQLAAALETAHKLIKENRNALGGHVIESVVKNALKNGDLEEQVSWEAGPTPDRLHLQFAQNLVMACFIRNVDYDFSALAARRMIKQIAQFTAPVVEAMDQIIRAYIANRGH